MKEINFKPRTTKRQLQYECMKDLIRIENRVYKKTATIYLLKRLSALLSQVK